MNHSGGLLDRSRLLEDPIFAGPKPGNIVPGVFTPVLAKLKVVLIDCISVVVDRMQRTFESDVRAGRRPQRSELTDTTSKQRGSDQVQAAGSMPLALEGSDPDFAERLKKTDRASELGASPLLTGRYAPPQGRS